MEQIYSASSYGTLKSWCLLYEVLQPLNKGYFWDFDWLSPAKCGHIHVVGNKAASFVG